MMKLLMPILALFIASLPVQAQDTIRANPNVQRLRVIWQIEGGAAGGDEVGAYVGGIGDIYGTGYSAWGVQVGRTGQLNIYAGGPEPLSTAPIDTFHTGGGINGHLISGDFWGTGHRAIGVFRSRSEGPTASSHYFLAIYRTDSNRIAHTPAVVWDSWRNGAYEWVSPREILACDIDGDGADELVVVCPITATGSKRSTYAITLIYHGGTNFRVDSPAVVIRDLDDNKDHSFTARTADIDGNHHADLLFGALYPSGASLKFFFGSDSALYTWDKPQRIDSLMPEFPLPGPVRFPSLGYGPVILDADGDAIADLFFEPLLGFRTGGGKNIHTRSLLRDSADFNFLGMTINARGGYLNDSLKRYEMLMAGNGNWLSGGIGGPDNLVDAQYKDELWTPYGSGSLGPIGDANGDGWEDYLTANWQYYGFNSGIALILAGGPYIPHDSTWLGVRDIATEEHSTAISIWPNPVHDELSIAWRGDLQRTPTRFVVHDMLGRLVASGEVDASRGSAVWPCGNAPSGAYILSIFDQRGAPLATMPFIKQE